MTSVYVYHLQRQALDVVLPRLLALSLGRGWRALVKVASPERLRMLDEHLWTFSDESFLAHGTETEAEAAAQPVLLTTGDANANGAAALFLADGAAVPEDIGAFERVALLLDGNDENAVAAGRQTWRDLRAAGHDVSYWQQDDDGRWQKRA